MSNAYTHYLVPIDHIKLQVFRNKDVKTMSVVKDEPYGIVETEMSADGRNTLLDARLGTTDPRTNCEKCDLDVTSCPGHFGHADLAFPCYNYAYIEIVRLIFSVTCLRCAKILIDKKTEEDVKKTIMQFKKGKNRLISLKNILESVKKCSNCGANVPKIKLDKQKNKTDFKLVAEYVESENQDDETIKSGQKAKKRVDHIYGKKAYEILRNISDEDARIMGFDPSKSRPEDFIIKTMPIPPLAIRPSVKTSITSSINYEDTLTAKLLEIIKTNNNIRKELDKESANSDKNLQLLSVLLQFSIVTLYDNETIAMPRSEQKSSNKPIKSISERIKGKQGLVRGAMMGKRVDYSARSVITSDPNLSLDELGIPIKVAMLVTMPEPVTPYNIEELQKLVKNGTDVYPGANYVIPGNQTRANKISWNLKYRKGFKIKPGDIVLRHMMNNDPTIFNRQPSLHKLSMQCHYANIIDDKTLNTFRLNVSATTPYNAD